MAGWTMDSPCWVKDDNDVYVEGTVVDVISEQRVRIEGRDDPVDTEDLLPRVPNQVALAKMDQLMELNAAEVLANVEKLYSQRDQQIYSSVGPTLIAMNPFVNLPSLYTPEKVKEYRLKGNESISECERLGPHCFMIAELAFQGLRDKSRQSVVICGESGAGKTFTNQKMLEYLLDAESLSQGQDEEKRMRTATVGSMASLGRTASGGSTTHGRFAESMEQVKQMIADANLLLESFGNAKTLRNDNSSRFGKYSQLHFEKDALAARSFDIEHYLLERSRVVNPPQRERNYHIFMQLLKSDQAPQYKLEADPQAYAYTRTKDGKEIKQVDGHEFKDAEDFSSLNSRLEKVGFTPAERDELFRVIAGILHLGNVRFVDNDSGAAELENSTIDSLSQACTFLGLDAGSLLQALVSKTTKTPRETYVSKVSRDAALVQRDAVAKMVYSRLFDYIVWTINYKLERHQPTKRATVGLLDIFGFEDMPCNGLEQMYINLANERIQTLFNKIMFERESEACREEGITLEFDRDANMASVEIFISAQKKPCIVNLLADQCRSNTGTDCAFVSQLVKQMKIDKTLCSSPFFAVETGSKEFRAMDKKLKAKKKNNGNDADVGEPGVCFVVKHYAGEVIYNAKNFVTKSKDKLEDHLAEVLGKSKNEKIAKLFEDSGAKEARDNHGKAKGKGAVTVGERFVKQLQDLATKLESGDGGTSFVRCIKPNKLSAKGLCERPLVMEQLRNGGVIDALKIRRMGYPDRMDFDKFCDEFWTLQRGWRRGHDNSARNASFACHGMDKSRAHCEDLLHQFIKEATHRFKGDMGISCDEEGFVQKVGADSQAHTKGIKEGDRIVGKIQIKEIVGTVQIKDIFISIRAPKPQPFSLAALANAEKSGFSYELTVIKAEDLYAIGRTKVFMKNGVLGILRSLKLERIKHYVSIVQWKWRERKHSNLRYAVEEANKRLADLKKDAERKRVDTVKLVAEALEAAQEEVDKALADVTPQQNDEFFGSRKSERLRKHKKLDTLGNIEKLIAQAMNEVAQEGQKIARAEQRLTEEIGKRTREANKLLDRVNQFVNECSGDASIDNINVDEDTQAEIKCQQESQQVCQKLKEKLEEIIRNGLPQLRKEFSVESDMNSDQYDDQVNKLAQLATNLLEGATTMMDETEKQMDEFREKCQKMDACESVATEALGRRSSYSSQISDFVGPGEGSRFTVFGDDLNDRLHHAGAELRVVLAEALRPQDIVSPADAPEAELQKELSELDERLKTLGFASEPSTRPVQRQSFDQMARPDLQHEPSPPRNRIEACQRACEIM